MCGIKPVLLLLLLIFYNILLLYCLVLLRTITAPGIPVRRNINQNSLSSYLGRVVLLIEIWAIFGNIVSGIRDCVFVLNRFDEYSHANS